MRLRDAFEEWPPEASWVTSYSGFDRVEANLEVAKILRATTHKDGVQLEIGTQERKFTTFLAINDPKLVAPIAQALSRAQGKRLWEAGEVELGPSK